MERITRKPTVATDEHHQNRGGWGVAREVGRQNFNAVSKSSQSLRRGSPGRGVLVEPDQTQARETLQQQGAMAATPEGGIDQYAVVMGQVLSSSHHGIGQNRHVAERRHRPSARTT